MKRRCALIWVTIALIFVAGCGSSAGDRVLVAKYYYETGFQPQRFDVVVFRFPKEPVDGAGVPTNYIKRLLGLAGETIAIFFGQLFYTNQLSYPGDAKEFKKTDLWEEQFEHQKDKQALELFRMGVMNPKEKGFQIIRKSPSQILAMRRIVYDNDYQAADLKGVLPPRWQIQDGNGWTAGAERKTFTAAGGDGWLRYQHILRPFDWPDTNPQSDRFVQPGGVEFHEIVADIKKRKHKPQFILDFLGYNSYESPNHADGVYYNPPNWVGDLMVEVDVKVDKAQGEFSIELAKGIDRFQARWDLSTGTCTLVRLQDGQPAKGVKLGNPMPTSLKGPGTYRVRFANFDERLTVWVDGNLPFGDGVAYKRPWYYDNNKGEWVNIGPTAHDLRPAGVGVKGASLQVSRLQLWRDTYYTVRNDRYFLSEFRSQQDKGVWSNPGDSYWTNLRTGMGSLNTMYVQPDHLLVLGDNSPESYDSRGWGLVPRRLLLGRALMVYWPASRLGTVIR